MFCHMVAPMSGTYQCMHSAVDKLRYVVHFELQGKYATRFWVGRQQRCFLCVDIDCVCEMNQTSEHTITHCKNTAGAYRIVLSLCGREKVKNIAQIIARPNSISHVFVATDHARIHTSSFPFNCHVVSCPIHLLMPIYHHLEDNWLPWFKIRSPCVQYLRPQVFITELSHEMHVLNGSTTPRSAEALEQMASWAWGW